MFQRLLSHYSKKKGQSFNIFFLKTEWIFISTPDYDTIKSNHSSEKILITFQCYPAGGSMDLPVLITEHCL